jgi:hypothetical protein
MPPKFDLSQASDTPPRTEFAFAVQIEIAPRKELGQTPWLADRYIVDVLDGVFEGPNIRGKVLPGGADWCFVRADGVYAFDARYMLQEDDGTLIYLQNRGYRWGSPDAMARMSRREDVDPSEYYMRVAPTFEVRAGPHDWLNKYVFFGVADKIPSGNIIRYYRVL